MQAQIPIRQCPRCDGVMELISVFDRASLFPKRHMWECESCHHMETPPDQAMRQAGAPPLIPE